jgi:hypothetical protein
MDLSAELRINQNTSTRESTYVWEPSQDVASARISPVVEERLLHDIYHRYVGETPHVGTTTSMTLSKFGRFTKDFGISIIAKGAAQPPFLVNGEIDVIFLNATQTTPENRDLPERAPRAFGVRAGAGTQQQYKRSAVGAAGAAPVLSAGQFVTAVKVLACQLYANVIEHETGTVLECLPPRQRETASRAVLDVLMKKKLVPVAERLGLIPWPLIYLDQTVTVLATFHDASSALSRNFRLVVAWFENYSSGSRGSLPYKSLSRFAHDFGMVPYLLKEPQLYRFVSLLFYYLSFHAPDSHISFPCVCLPQSFQGSAAVGTRRPGAAVEQFAARRAGRNRLPRRCWPEPERLSSIGRGGQKVAP